MAAGSRQSPVNIETKRAESDHEALSSKPLRWKYPATASRKLVNPGYCWRIDTDGEGTCEYRILECSSFSFRVLDIFSSFLLLHKQKFVQPLIVTRTTSENITWSSDRLHLTTIHTLHKHVSRKTFSSEEREGKSGAAIAVETLNCRSKCDVNCEIGICI